MGISNSIKHKGPHKYVRIRIGRNKDKFIFRCAIDGCIHKLLIPELVIGRVSLCNECGNEFIIDKLAYQLAKPHCINCGKSPKKILNKDIEDILSKLG